MEETINEKQRIKWEDNLKAFAIFLVVLGHTGLEGQSAAYNVLREWIYSFHMPLFYLLSGISFSLVLNKGRKIVKNHLLNLIIIYCLQSIIYIVFNVLANRLLNVQTQSTCNIRDILSIFIDPVGHFWYLQVLIIVYLFAALLNGLVKNEKLRLLIALVLAFIGMNTNIKVLSRAMYEFLYFECGIQILNVKKIPWQVCLIGVCASFVKLFVSINNIYLDQLITVFIALSVSLFLVFMFSKKENVRIPLVTAMGQNCLWIYIFHTYFTSVTRNICNRIMPTLPEISVIVVTIIGVIGPMVVMYVFKKMRIDKIVVKPIDCFKRR